jgi:hypothetical protein
MDHSARSRQRAVFRGVCGQLVDNQAKWRRQISRQQDWFALELNPVGTIQSICPELAARERAEIGALPFGLHKQVMRGCERQEPTTETIDKVLAGMGAQRLRRYGLHHSQDILDAMTEFIK